MMQTTGDQEAAGVAVLVQSQGVQFRTWAIQGQDVVALQARRLLSANRGVHEIRR